VQPLALGRDARGRERWLAFVGAPDLALGALRLARAANGSVEIRPVERWPAAVRVVGALQRNGVAYVLVESIAALDQPGGLRAVWIEANEQPSPFEASPMSLADVHDMDELAARLERTPAGAGNGSERNAASLLATLRAASMSPVMLARSLASEGADVETSWQSVFALRTARLSEDSASRSAAATRALAIVRAALATPACGADACEAWGEDGHAVVRFAVEGGRWVLRAVIEDAPVAHLPRGTAQSRTVDSVAEPRFTEAVLRAGGRAVRQVLGEAPLGPGAGTIGVAMTDGAPDIPFVVVREGAAARLFAVDAGGIRAAVVDPRWEAAFADVDGDGRTDVVVRMNARRVDGGPLVWTQAFLAPPPSVQASSLQADLASALATMDAPDALAAARAASSLPIRGVTREEACRLLSAATTPAGFRRVAAPDARLLLFDEPGMPTWRPKVVPADKIAADDVRGLGMHCAELSCERTRPYCSWSGGADSTHFWFAWRDGRVEIAGAADYQGE
jgi:hypothetical protein